MHPITGYVHHYIAELAQGFSPATILDVGGTGKLAAFTSVPVTDVNLRDGVDGTALPFADESFDVVVSVATLEHVSEQLRFVEESIRVARFGVAHWFPFGEGGLVTERYKADISRRCGGAYVHGCSVPSSEFALAVERLGGTCCWHSLVTVPEHLLLLSTLYEPFNNPETFDFARRHHGMDYGTTLVIDLRRSA